jgi:GAF domain-containing protein
MKSLKVQNDAILSLTRLFTQPLERSSLLERILEVDTETLEVARVGIWLYDADHNGIELLDLFETASRRHARDGYLSVANCPAYFAAIDDTRVLAIDDVSGDPATAELFDTYLSPLGITSMLAAPVLIEGRLP